jgi:hypothetical protein
MNRPRVRTLSIWCALALGFFVRPAPSSAQVAQIDRPIEEIEQLMTFADFQVEEFRGTRFPGDRTYYAILQFDDDSRMEVKWAPAPEDGGEFNNRPRFEVAAYRIQQLFLDEDDYTVPPTLCRFIPLEQHPATPPEREVERLFDDMDEVLVVLQYWLKWVNQEEEAEDIFDEDLFDENPVYAKHLANLNLLTYLIRHRDSNRGNFLTSMDPNNPRVFSVDNGVAFTNEQSALGRYWQRIRVDAFPKKSIDRLRALTPEILQEKLGVLEQFELNDAGRMVATTPTENLDPGKGVRRTESMVQIGLTEREINQVWDRIENLLEDVDEGKYELF